MTTLKTIASVFVLLAVVGGLALGATGGVAAQESTTTDLPYNETVTVDNSTDTVYVDLENVSNGPVNVTLIGHGDSDVQEATTQLNSTDPAHEFTADPSTYDSYTVEVDEDASDTDTESVETIDIGTFQQVSGGGGGFGLGSGSTPIVLVAIVGVLALIMVKE
jgi:hypothetical protein